MPALQFILELHKRKGARDDVTAAASTSGLI
jgi:hypothetical protein